MLRGPTVRHRGFSPRQFNFQNTFKTYNNNVLPAGDMTRLKLLAQAEKVAFEASNDTQDSQAILDALKAQFGVGTVRTRRTTAAEAVCPAWIARADTEDRRAARRITFLRYNLPRSSTKSSHITL